MPIGNLTGMTDDERATLARGSRPGAHGEVASDASEELCLFR